MTSQFFGATGIPYAGGAVKRGSALRDGRTIIGFGGVAASIAAGATSEIEVDIREPGVLGKLVVGGIESELAECTVTSIKLNNDELLSGECPASMFAQDSMASPGLGHTVRVNDNLIVTVKNYDGSNATGMVSAGFSVG